MKKKRIKTGIIAALSGVVALPGCNNPSSKQVDTVIPSEQTGANGPNVDSAKLEGRLKELSQTEYAGELAPGAMCYEPAAPMYMDYLCSYCGKAIKEKYNDWEIYNISHIEELVEQIKSKGYDVILDKKEFCPHCSGKSIENPELIFKIRFSSDADYHIVKSNVTSDYQCLLAFLSDKDKYAGGQGFEYALHDNIAVIQKMTGLGKDLEVINGK